MTRQSVWGIPVPADAVPLTPDVVLVPLVGFDEEGFRLGYGGGYYDRYLAAHPQTIANAEYAKSKGRTGTRIKIIRHLRPEANVRAAIVVE